MIVERAVLSGLSPAGVPVSATKSRTWRPVLGLEATGALHRAPAAEIERRWLDRCGSLAHPR